MPDSSTPTARDLLGRAFEKYETDPIATFEGETWTYGTVWERGGRLANALYERGFEKGTFVGTMMSNQLDYFTAVVACVRGGFVNVPMNDMLTRDEFSYILSDSSASVAIVGENFTETLAEIRPDLPDLEYVIAIDDQPPEDMHSLSDVLDDAESGTVDVSIDPDDLVQLSYTGGTTGQPKGAKHTHGTFGMDELAHALEFDIRHGETMLIMTPLPHAAGYISLGALLKGAHITITAGFDPGEFLRLVEERHITWSFMVPTMLYRTLDHEALESTDTSSLETILYGASPITRERLTEALDAFGPVFIQAFGQTEMPNVGTVLPKADHTEAGDHLDSCGKAAAMVDIRIANPQETTDTDPLPVGEEGEILLQSPYVMVGYHGKPEKTAETLVDGWLRTGDIGRKDEAGYVYLLDRKNDMVISGGMNVYTTTVEDALDEHPNVKQVAVIGIPDSDWGEAVHAVVVPDGDVDEETLRAFADERLAAYEKPKRFEFVDSIPETPYGKPDKTVLRAPYWDDEGRQIS